MVKSLSVAYSSRLYIDPITKVSREIYLPLIPIRLSIGTRKTLYPLEALMDSGSDENLFPARIGEVLGIDFKKIEMKILYGIGESKIIAYNAKITVWIDNEKFETSANFSYKQKELILGRDGFFNLFKEVTFREGEKYLELVFKD